LAEDLEQAVRARPRARGRRASNGRASRAPSSTVAHDAEGRAVRMIRQHNRRLRARMLQRQREES
jgi:hypothetical protein